MENYAEKAKQLKAEKEQREQVQREQEAIKAAEAAKEDETIRKLTEEKTRDLLALFKQFNGYKIADDRVTLEAEIDDAHEVKHCACLKIDSVDGSLVRWGPGTVLFAGQYVSRPAGYILHNCHAGASHVTVGRYKTADELMNALAQEVANL